MAPSSTRPTATLNAPPAPPVELRPPEVSAAPVDGVHPPTETKPADPLTQATRMPRRILLIGPDAALEKPRLPADVQADTADSFLEAVLLMGPDAKYETIIAGVSQEIDQLEQAITSLRKVAEKTILHLLCAPVDEPACRRARAWGAADYHVLPLSKSTLDRVLSRPRKRSVAPADALAVPVKLSVAQLPLVVHNVMVTDLLSGRSDFVERAVATLQAYMNWHGRMRFEPQLPEAAVELLPNVQRANVTHEDLTFGCLALSGGDENEIALLGQAASWLGGWMAMAHRHEQLRTLAITDELSGAYNRRYFNRFTASLLERAKTERFRVTILLFDIDNFKLYNDEFGHAAGDSIIRDLIKLLRNCTRPHDLVARLGGDEFAVVFWDNEAPRQPGSQHPKDVLAATERFRNTIASHDWFKGCNIQGKVEISGGLATFPWDGDTVDVLVAKADAALLKAKATGKNAIVLHEEPAPSK